MRRCSTIAVLLLLAGCTSLEGRDAARYERDGQTYGVVEGTFSGRWWSFYERGRSYLDGGFYAEAEQDLRTALVHRATDQRWARTYGLHFTPEYFPNRELGIVRFHQGDFAAAIERLETSLSQEHTALAAHFLDRARAARIGDGDTASPVIELDAQVEGVAGALEVPLRFSVADNHFVSRITIDGEPYSLTQSQPEVTGEVMLTLSPGINRIEVRAEDLSGNEAIDQIEILTDQDGPAITFDAPVALPGALRGRLLDPAGVASLMIAGQAAALTARSDGVVMFALDAANAVPTPPVVFEARDTLGNITRGRLPLTRVDLAQRNGDIVFAAAPAPVPLGHGLVGYWHGDTLIRVELAANETAAPSVRLYNLTDGQRYLMDEIVVSIEIRGVAGGDTLFLNGMPVEGLLRQAPSQIISRRIRLDGFEEHVITAELKRASGDSTVTSATVVRAPTAVEMLDARLRVAMLGSLWDGAVPRLEGEADFVMDELSRALYTRGRFDLVSRDALPRVLEEQELRAVLGSRDLDAALRSVASADLLTVGKVRRTGDTAEIILQAVDATTSTVLGYADVAGPARTLEELRDLIGDLALRFEQEFPRVQGRVVDAPSPSRCFSTLAREDRVRADLPCVIFRYGDPIVHPETGAALGRPVEIVEAGTIREVQAAMSRIALDSDAKAEPAVRVNDYVVTK